MRKVFLMSIIGFLMWMFISGLIICIAFEPEPDLNMKPCGIMEDKPTEYDYRIIPCNIAGTDNYDYVIEVVTRDPSEVEDICLRLGGVEK